MANKHMERCPMSLPIRVIKIKTTVSYHFTPTIIKKQIITNADKDVEKLKPSCIGGMNVKWYDC